MLDFIRQIGEFIAFGVENLSFIISAIGNAVGLLNEVISANGFGSMLSVTIGATVAVLVVRQIFGIFTGGNPS